MACRVLQRVDQRLLRLADRPVSPGSGSNLELVGRSSATSTATPATPTAPRGCTPSCAWARHAVGPQTGGAADARPRHRRGAPPAPARLHRARPGRRALDGPGAAPVPSPTARTRCGSPTSPSTAPGEGWVYCAVVLDVFSRRVVGWSIADHLRTELVVDALDMARWRRATAPGRPCPLRPRQPIHVVGVRPAAAPSRAARLDGLDRRLLRQRAGRELLLLAAGRTAGPPILGDPPAAGERDLRVDRDISPTEAVKPRLVDSVGGGPERKASSGS